jgi:hypothetical protein
METTPSKKERSLDDKMAAEMYVVRSSSLLILLFLFGDEKARAESCYVHKPVHKVHNRSG